MNVGKLIAHPEGGHFREVFRSRVNVLNANNEERTALTHIYFALEGDEVSKFHKVESDEVWNLYEGRGVVVYVWDDQAQVLESIKLSAESRAYCCIVESGLWQAAKPLDGPVLTGCSVAPGFEFSDFSLIDADGDVAQRILCHSPELAEMIRA